MPDPAVESAPTSTPVQEAPYDFMSSIRSAAQADGIIPADPSPPPAPRDTAPTPKQEPAPAAKAEPKAAEPTQEPTDSGMLEKLMKGEAVEVKPSSNDAPKDPNSREFHKWAELRNAYEKEAKRALELERQKAEIEGRIPKDYDALKQRAEEAERALAARDLTARPEFQNAFTRPLENIYADFDKVADQFKLSKAVLAEAIQDGDALSRERKLNGLFNDMDEPPPASYIARLALKADQMHDLFAAQNAYLADPKNTINELDSEKNRAAEAQKARDAEEYSRASNVAMQVLQQSVPVLRGDGSERMLSEVKDAFQKDFNSLKPAQRALTLAAPVLLQAMLKAQGQHQEQVSARDKEIASLKLQLSKLTQASPSTTVSTPTAPTDNGGPWSSKDFGKLLEASMPVVRL